MANKILKTLTLPNAQGEPVTYELHPDWDNVEGKPETYPADWNNIENKPESFVTNWNDIPDKPETYPTNWEDITNKPDSFGVGEFYEVDGAVKGEIFNDYDNNIASGDYAHAEGAMTNASGMSSHAEGQGTFALGNYSHAEGQLNLIRGAKYKSGSTNEFNNTYLKFNTAQNLPSFKINSYYMAYLNDNYVGMVKVLHSGGMSGGPDGNYVHYSVENNSVLATNTTYDFYEPSGVGATGIASHAEGDTTSAIGDFSHVEGCMGGFSTPSLGGGSLYNMSDTELVFGSTGYNVQLDEEIWIYSADFPPLDTELTLSSDGVATIDGKIRLIEILYTFDPGTGESPYQEYLCEIISGDIKTGISYQVFNTEPTINPGSIARGKASHAEGISTIATADGQHVEGRYNIEDTAKKYAHITGIGAQEERKNGFTLDWHGNAWYAGTMTTKAVIIGDISYGDTLPTAGVEGQLFFLIGGSIGGGDITATDDGNGVITLG